MSGLGTFSDAVTFIECDGVCLDDHVECTSIPAQNELLRLRVGMSGVVTRIVVGHGEFLFAVRFGVGEVLLGRENFKPVPKQRLH